MAVRSGLLTKMVMGLVLTVCQSAQSMETGYDYASNVSIKKHILRDDLRCTYMFSGLTHMLLTNYLLSFTGPPNYTLPLAQVVSEIRVHYSRIIKYHIDSLHRLKLTRMGALWALYLYLGTINDNYETSLHMNATGQAGAHGFVITQLVNDLDDCRKPNSFDVYETIIKSNPNPSVDELRRFISDNINRANDLLENNNVLRDQLSNDNIDTTLQVGSIFLNNMGRNDVYKEDLMNVYNVQVDWSDTSERLAKSWHDMRILNWHDKNFENIRVYYILNFNFLKIIMLQLTIKHLHYLEPYVGTKLYSTYAKQWCNLVKRFGNILNLSQDYDVKALIVSLNKLSTKKETIDNVVGCLIPIVKTLCLPLGCEASEKFELNGKEFQTPYKSPIKDEMNIEFLKIEKSLVTIEYHSLENTKMFLNYLSRMFKYVDFNLIRSLVEYLYEVNS